MLKKHKIWQTTFDYIWQINTFNALTQKPFSFIQYLRLTSCSRRSFGACLPLVVLPKVCAPPPFSSYTNDIPHWTNLWNSINLKTGRQSVGAMVWSESPGAAQDIGDDSWVLENNPSFPNNAVFSVDHFLFLGTILSWDLRCCSHKVSGNSRNTTFHRSCRSFSTQSALCSSTTLWFHPQNTRGPDYDEQSGLTFLPPRSCAGLVS